jgi:hypothetical protein
MNKNKFYFGFMIYLQRLAAHSFLAILQFSPFSCLQTFKLGKLYEDDAGLN